MATLDFWFDFASTYSYPAAMRIAALAAEVGVVINWKAFLLGPIFAAQGMNDSPFNLYPAKGQYMWRDLERICSRYDLPFQRPQGFPQNSVLAARVAVCFADQPWLPAFVQGVYTAQFAEQQQIADPAVIMAILATLGLDGDRLLAEAQAPEAKPLLRARTEQASALGLFGAPTLMVGQELFWGHDRLDEALLWAQQLHPLQR